MGIFPILMNIIQFWLIDSIVKASSVAVGLDIEQGAHDSEPLFQGCSDDEDDRAPRRSSSLSNSRRLDTPNDLSLDTHTFQIIPAKESTSPSDSHFYPPSLSGSISSNVLSSHEHRLAKNLAKQTKRRNVADTTEILGSSSLPQTPPQVTHAPAVTEGVDWAESWDDADEWDHRKSNSLGKGDWNNMLQGTEAK